MSYKPPVQIPSIVELYYTAITLKKHQNFGSFEEMEGVQILSSWTLLQTLPRHLPSSDPISEQDVFNGTFNSRKLNGHQLGSDSWHSAQQATVIK